MLGIIVSLFLKRKLSRGSKEQCRVVDFIMSLFRLLVDVFLIVWVLCCGYSGIKTLKCCDLCFKLGHTTVNAMIGRICVWQLQIFLVTLERLVSLTNTVLILCFYSSLHLGTQALVTLFLLK